MKTIGYKYDDYKYVIDNNRDSYYAPNVKKEEVVNGDKAINILGYFSLLNPHSFIYGSNENDNKNKENTSARISDYLGKGKVEGREVYAIVDYITYASDLNNGKRERRTDSCKVSLYQIDQTNIKRIGEITKLKNGKEEVSWLDDTYISGCYPIVMEKGKEYYRDISLEEPYKTYDYTYVTGFKNLTVDKNYFKDCIEIKEILVCGGSIIFTTRYYTREYGMFYCEGKNVFIDEEKKEITFYPTRSDYFIKSGKDEWAELPLNITSFVADQKQNNTLTEANNKTTGSIMSSEEALDLIRQKTIEATIRPSSTSGLVIEDTSEPIKTINGRKYYTFILIGKAGRIGFSSYHVDIITGSVYKDIGGVSADKWIILN